jgi:diguanylate cyclase (GGDEF)-like protein/PAS domain S-box-containing protein
MTPRLHITAKLALTFVAFAALLLASVAAFYYQSARSTLRAAAVSELLVTGLEKQAALESWLAQRVGAAQRLAALPATNEAGTALSAARGAMAPARTTFLAQARSLIGPARTFLRVRLLESEEGVVLASTDLDEEGGRLLGAELLARAREASVVERMPALGSGVRPRLRIGTPVFDAEGRRVSVLVADADLGELQAILSRRSGIRRSHDVFLLDDGGRYLSHPRLVRPDTALGRASGPVANTCAQHDDGVRYGLDHRGVATINAVRWVAPIDACLVVKLDEQEAYEPVRHIQQVILAAGGLVLLFGSLAAWLLAGLVTGRLRVLQHAVTRFAAGERDALPERVSAGHDEIAQLGRSLGDMMATLSGAEQELREHAARLEQRIADRTAALQDSETRFRTIAASALDPLLSVGDDLRIVFFNPAAARTFGAQPNEIQGRPLERLFASGSLAALDTALEDAARRAADDPGRAVELVGRRTGGEEFPVEVSIAAWVTGGRRFYTLLVRDITERKALVDALRDLSLRDELTGLHNRRGFFALAEEHRKLAQRRGQAFSLLFIDLDGFKRINDTYGHEAGDRVLQGVARLLRQVFRDSDILARLGGDEFVALLTDTGEAAAAHSVTRLRGVLDEANRHASDAERVGFSLGVVCFDPAKPEALDQLMYQADAAMYAQKKARKAGGGAD